MKTITIAISLVLLGGTAFAQTEDDHATRSSGHDPNAQPALQPKELPSETTAPVEDVNKVFGIGYGATPGGVVGIEAEYYLGNLMLNGHLGFSLISPDVGDSTSLLAFAAGAFYRWKVQDNVALMIGGRIGLGHATSGEDDGGGEFKLPQSYEPYGDATQINLEGVLRVQCYFAGIIGVHAEVGPVLSIIDEGGRVLGDSSDSSISSEGIYLALPTTLLLASFGVVIYTN